jgi:hypothetical protein
VKVAQTVILSEQKLNLLFDEIASGFIHSPLEISAFIIFILSFFAPFIFLHIYQLKKQNEEKSRVSQRIFKRFISMNNLGRPDIEQIPAAQKSVCI